MITRSTEAARLSGRKRVINRRKMRADVCLPDEDTYVVLVMMTLQTLVPLDPGLQLIYVVEQ